jgi:hypothetical protein
LSSGSSESAEFSLLILSSWWSHSRSVVCRVFNHGCMQGAVSFNYLWFWTLTDYSQTIVELFSIPYY